MFDFFAKSRRRASRAPLHRPEAALVITTYQKPRHLKLVLESVAVQRGVDEQLEVVVADDGSTDETEQVVERFARSVQFPVNLTTHRHQAFQVSRSRNEGAAASSAPYVIFIDGDCLIGPDFVAQHLRRRKLGVAMNGDCHRLDESVSSRIDEGMVRSGEYAKWAPESERRRIRADHRKARWYNLIHHRWRPHLLGNNIGIWRTDFERVNGFDESFEGWGNEDDDLGYRLRQAKVRIQSILPWTKTYHIWHPRDATWTADWHDGANVARLFRKNRPTRCANGLLKLGPTGIGPDGVQTKFDLSDATKVMSFTAAFPERERRLQAAA